jgi:hypothetical protein
MDALAVFQDEDQRQEQDDGEQRGGDPDSADACPPDDVVDGGGCARAGFAGAAVPGAAGWVPPAGCDVMDRISPSSYVAFTFPAC